MTFEDLTPAEAEAYRARVEADGPARLTALAELLVADGLSLDEFDGTPQSLVPLWRWFVGFAREDFPGVELDAVPRSYSVEAWRPELARLYYASEMIEDYIVEVAAVCFVDLAWVVNPDKGFERFQRPTIQYWSDDGHRGFSEPQRHGGGFAKFILEGDTRFEYDTFLADHFFRAFLSSRSTTERCRNLPRGASILAPLLDGGIDHLPYQQVQAREPVYPRTAIPTLVVMKQQKAAADAEPAGDELVLAHKTANVESLDQAIPLEPAVISVMLAKLGFASLSGEAPTVANILAEDFTEFYLDEDAMATTMVTDGQLRAVQLASITTTKKTWTKLTAAFTKAGRPMGAKLAREDEFMPEDDA